MLADWKSELDALIVAHADEVVALRRHIHAHPEPSGSELQTSMHLYQALGRLQLKVRVGPDGCGVIADGGAADSTPRIAMRGDIDALRIQDEKKTDYASTTPGVMHACGHDAHSAMVYGAAAALTRFESTGLAPWPLSWRAIFQPAEETAVGAAQMIEAGALEGVERILSLHVDPTRRSGEIGLRSGPLTAHCDMLLLTVHGQGGHGARPHESRDPIAAAALLINTLYQFVPRASDLQDAVVLTFGQVRGGENSNVIPETVELRGTLRTLDVAVRTGALEKIRQVVSGVEAITSTEIAMEIQVSIPGVHNDTDLTHLVWNEAEEVLGEANVKLIARPSMGSEDFACYLEHIPGLMFRLGSTRDLAASTPLHTSTFDIDESALSIGTRVLARSIITACRTGVEC
jgi:amidohydrolase